MYPRVNYERTLALFTAFEGELPEIAQPSDETLFEVALCAPGNSWPFVRAHDTQLNCIWHTPLR